MTEPSKEAWRLAHSLPKPVAMLGQDLRWVAEALQQLMDERDLALKIREDIRDGHGSLEEAYREVCNDVHRLEEEKLALTERAEILAMELAAEKDNTENQRLRAEAAERRLALVEATNLILRNCKTP